MKKRFLSLPFFLLVIATVTKAQALTAPFTEDFATADVSDWGDSSSVNATNFNALTFVGSGGPDGSSYASTNFAFATGGGAGGSSAVLFRGHDEFGDDGASDGAFIGNWLAGTVQELTAFVRHNAPVPLTHFMRASNPTNFPGGTAINFVPVLPNQWTEISFDVTPNSNQFVTFEDTSHRAVFSNIGHVQLGVNIPDAFSMNPTPFSFDIDQIRIAVPEPTTLGLLGLALTVGSGWRRRI